MPIYEYECPTCSHNMDFQHGMKEHPAVTCPKCLNKQKQIVCMDKLISPGGTPKFNGSGFYQTDYKDKGK